MRKYLIYLTIPAMVACGSKEPKQSTIAGKFSNATDNTILIVSPNDVDTVNLADDGSFSYKLSLAEPAQIKVKYGRMSNILFLQPGDSSYIELDLNNANQVSFTGSNSDINTNIKSRTNNLYNIMRGWRDLFALDVKDFEAKIDSIKNALMAQSDSLKAKSNELAEMEGNRIRYFLLNIRTQYPQYSAYLQGKSFNPDSADYSFLDKVDMNNGEHLSYDDYASLLETYAELRLQKMKDFATLDSMPAEQRLPVLFNMVDSIFTNSKVRDYIKKHFLVDEIQFGEFWKLTNVCNKYVEACSTPLYKKEVQNIMNEKMKIAPGKDAPTFSYKDINGKEYSLADFKGNLVYIDFWATWCGPCRGELPHLDKLEKEYKGKKIVFVKMSLDDDMNAWRKMVTEKKLGGVQLHADGAWSSDAAKNYQIKGIPTFVLIDANGKIVSPSAPRPSSEEIRPLLDQELAKI
ncbi:TlpA disulfide reductase family protein [Tenuifilum thalassicum]|uniref:AhpC/TSA family protein n=1 Tax=Tenuifilum thalassicum TaxID=2590900 RepID=A0A7D4BAS3_9BACT|nr:TlpA disulfide reductase family protein [Tenuifilum thalassicum]QKG79620.1 AhpC/TSA family protein [Tenuifilum thalassicum]